MASLQIYLAVILEKYQDISEVGADLKSVKSMRDIKFKFILVVKNAKDISWLVGPVSELKNRLLQVRKIWGIDVVVLNEELAREYKLII